MPLVRRLLKQNTICDSIDSSSLRKQTAAARRCLLLLLSSILLRNDLFQSFWELLRSDFCFQAFRQLRNGLTRLANL